MKRYISAVLISCLLVQLCGCYSYREITLEELKNYNGENDIKIITDKDTILINRDSTEIIKYDWVVSDTSILVQEKRSLDSSDKKNPIHNEREIKFHQIKNLAINEPDSVETEGLIFLGVIVVSAVTALLISISTNNFHIF